MVALLAAWAVVSLAGLVPLNGPPPGAESVGVLRIFSIVAIGLYGYAAWRYLRIHGSRGDGLSLAVGVAFISLGEATLAVAFSRNWHLSWWEWHVLMLAAFVAIALGARDEYRRRRSLSAAFGGLYSEATLARIDRWHARAIASVAAAEARHEPTERVLDDLRQEGASDEEIALLAGTARELHRLDALFRPYLPAGFAEQIRRQRRPARLGGEEREVTVLFADLAGFTTFSERRRPTEVINMLNRFWAVVLFFTPDLWIGSRARSRQEEIGRDLPEALDLLSREQRVLRVSVISRLAWIWPNCEDMPRCKALATSRSTPHRRRTN